ncbi:DUF6454 family protein [Paenibacillus cremeus]|uniref:Uncharacterized protein n=1 Tax=Paenibacillus cremeus TaxID=2163881 RepID=A0A559KI32_9BACL|nr:DUF6454 family protein [Paenibacillus cremeus]TVY11781.1 hypothetical protein FPZ49_00345 [Paenibacillus cremeus]
MTQANAANLFRKLTRHTKWELKQAIPLQFNNHHAQGMLRIGDLFYMSSVELSEWPKRYDVPSVDGFDRTPGVGMGHLFVFDLQGELVQDVMLGEGDAYHPGGIDWDGTSIWVPVAEYRPQSRSLMYRVNLQTLKAEIAFRVPDHIGGVVRLGQDGDLVGNSWASRKFYVWNAQGELLKEQDNSSHFVDYQDGHYIGEGLMLVSGIAELPHPSGGAYELGGLALIDMHTLRTLHEVPITLYSPGGHVITRNPVFLEPSGDELRLYAVPDDDQGTLLIYETSHLGRK